METSTLDIVGRDDELAAIDGFMDAAGARALLIEGEAGVGKSALCDAAVAAATSRGFRVLRTRPVEAEAELALAGVGDLLEPVLDRVLEGLPTPQARALRIALLLEHSRRVPDARALGVALLGALRLLAAERPLLVVVDDVHWLDPSSAAVVAFAARRLGPDNVALVAARRADHDDRVSSSLERVERLSVRGLSPGAVQRLLHDRLGLVLPRPKLRLLHELSAGNPFYALELGRALEQRDIRLEHGEALPPALDVLVGRRIATLPAATREALAIMAAVSRPTVAHVGGDDILTPALRANVVVVATDGSVRFAHPLLAAAAYASVDVARRRLLHRTIADEAGDIEERARHLALATDGVDLEIARELEAAALTARRRGAPAAAVELAERARALTPPDDDAWARRAVASAAHAFAAGDIGLAIATLDEVLAADLAPAERAAALHALGRIYLYEGDQPLAVRLFEEALSIGAAAPAVRADAELALATTLFYMREDLQAAFERTSAAVELAQNVGEPYLLANARSMRAVIGTAVGRKAAPEDIEAAFGEWETPFDRPILVSHLGFNVAIVDMWTDRLEEARAGCNRAYARALADGDDAALSIIASHWGLVECLAGRWSDARTQAEDALAAALEAGQRPQHALALAVRALVSAHRGEGEQAQSDAERALELTNREAMVARITAESALGLLDLSAARFAEVVERLEPLAAQLEGSGVREPGTMRFVPDYIEALIGVGRVRDAQTEQRKLAAVAAEVDRPSALAAAGRCAALIAAAERDVDTALAAFEAALEQHGRVPMPFEHARTVLARGVVLRRAHRRREARDELARSAATFGRLGAALWAERAHRELARIGGRTSSGDELTPTEQRVVELVAEGLQNREVAAALFVTTKTVEFHLRNVFRKLDVRSRAELARRSKP